jgi:hypothetical protein
MAFPPNKKLTAEDEKTIISAYREGKTAAAILLMMNGKFKTSKTVYDVLKKHGITSRNPGKAQADLDHFYFSAIDRPEKAYILGLLVTDGWIQRCRSEVGVQLVVDDQDVIEKVRQEWKSKRRLIFTKKRPFKGKSGKVYSATRMVRIAIDSAKMKEDLSYYGIRPAKSKTAWLPLLPDDMMPHLIRGIIDGDGAIYNHSKTGRPCVRFFGSPYLVAQIALFLTMKLRVSYRNPGRIKSSDFLSYVDYSRDADVSAIVRYAYASPVIAVQRKLARAKDIISQAAG